MTARKWTIKAEDELRRLWNNGQTASEIEKYFDKGFTRNAIIGKVHRMGLQKRPSPIVKKNKSQKHKVYPAPVAPPPEPTGKKLEELKPNECRWPYGDAPNLVFCSGNVENGVYCEHHNSIAYLTQKRGQNGNSKKYSGLHRR